MVVIKEYLFSYRWNGDEYGFSIPAESEAEARERAKVIGLNRYEGVLIARYPAGTGWLARLGCWIHNTWRGATHEK